MLTPCPVVPPVLVPQPPGVVDPAVPTDPAAGPPVDSTPLPTAAPEPGTTCRQVR
jgi:hypothetical protein